MTTYQSTAIAEEVPAAGASTVQEVAAVAGEIEHAEPKSGGSYVRDLDTGALIQTAGQAPDDQPEQEQ